MSTIIGEPGPERADQTVYEILKKLPEKWVVYAQPIIVYKGKPYHPDYVLLHPEVGIVVLEVKDRAHILKVTPDHLYVERNGREEREEAPWKQVEKHAHHLVDRLQENPLLRNQAGKLDFPYRYAVVFPSAPLEAIEIMRQTWGEMVIGPQDLLSSEALIQAIRNLWVPDYPWRLPLTEEQISAIDREIKPSAEIQKPNNLPPPLSKNQATTTHPQAFHSPFQLTEQEESSRIAIIYSERCPICNNILIEGDCPICDKAKTIKPLNVRSLRHPPRKPDISPLFAIKLTNKARDKLQEMGISNPDKDIIQWLKKRPHVYIFNGGESKEGEPRAIIRFAIDIERPINQDIYEAIGGVLVLEGVFLGYSWESTNIEDEQEVDNLWEEYDAWDDYNKDRGNFLIINVQKAPPREGRWAGKRCLCARLIYSQHSVDFTPLLEALAKIPSASEDRRVIRHTWEPWAIYLEILERNVKDKQYRVPYQQFWSTEEGCVVFLLPDSKHAIPWASIKGSIGWPLQISGAGYLNPPSHMEIGEVADFSREERTLTVKLKSPDLINQIPKTGTLFYDAWPDQIQIKRLQRGMERLERRASANPALADFIFDGQQATPIQKNKIRLTRSQILLDKIFENPAQLQAVQGALAAKDLFLVQGPPGTGKTTIIAEICYQFARQGKRVLIASQTNLAVDNALARLVKRPEIRIIRLGRPERVEEEGLPFIEDNVITTWLQDTQSLVEKRLREEEILLRQVELELEKTEEKIHVLVKALNLRKQENESKSLLKEKKDQEKKSSQARERTIKLRQSAKKGVIDLLEQIQGSWNELPEEVQNACTRILKPPPTVVEELGEVASSGNIADICQYLLLWLKQECSSDEQDKLALVATLVLKMKEQTLQRLEQDLRQISQYVEDKMLCILQAKQEWLQRLLDQEITSEIEAIQEQTQRLQRISKQIQRAVKQHLEEVVTDTSDVNNLARYLEKYANIKQWVEEISQRIPDFSEEILTYQKRQEEDLAYLEVEIQQISQDLSDIRKRIAPLKEKTNKLWGMRIASTSLRKQRKRKEELTEELERLKQRQKYREFLKDWLKRLQQPTSKDLDDLRRVYIDNVNIVGITCSGAGRREFLEDYADFDCVIIDEVSKATPPELILPALKGKKVVLIGDHKQLPPLLEDKDLIEVAEQMGLSEAEKQLLARSLFEQLFEEADQSLKVMLTTQYRMHPQIMDVINQFYDNKLQCGLPNPDRVRAHGLEALGPHFEHHVVWIDIPLESRYFEQRSGTSYKNLAECHLIANLLRRIEDIWQQRLDNKLSQHPLQVGVISFYAAQVDRLERLLDTQKEWPVKYRIGTVDRFQGMEQEIVVVSLVRNNAEYKIGFARRPQRINVAFSRAQKLLVIVGCASLFTNSRSGKAASYYKNIYNIARRSKAIIPLAIAPDWLKRGAE